MFSLAPPLWPHPQMTIPTRRKVQTSIMSLLDCICCCRHHLRTALCWDSPDEPSARFLTYSFLFEQADAVCTTLRSFNQSTTESDNINICIEDGQSSPVAIYGRSCPEVLCALLGIMSLPAPYMPLDLSQSVASRWSTMREFGVHIILIELSLFSVSIT
jgi:acyl-CoA synthetase (AMP-forming)/AMP-acid ligase II